MKKIISLSLSFAILCTQFLILISVSASTVTAQKLETPFPMKSVLDFERGTDFILNKMFSGPNPGDYFKYELVTNEGVNNSVGYKVSFLCQNTPSPWGGHLTLDFPTNIKREGSTYFSLMMKGDGKDHRLTLTLLGDGGITGSTYLNTSGSDWNTYQCRLDSILNFYQPSVIKGIKLSCESQDTGSIIFDDFTFYTPDYDLGDITIDANNYPNVYIKRSNGGKTAVAIAAAYTKGYDQRLIKILYLPLAEGNSITNFDCSDISVDLNYRISIMVWEDLNNMQTSVDRVDIN